MEQIQFFNDSDFGIVAEPPTPFKKRSNRVEWVTVCTFIYWDIQMLSTNEAKPKFRIFSNGWLKTYFDSIQEAKTEFIRALR